MVLKYIFPTESITCFKNLTLTPLTTFSTVPDFAEKPEPFQRRSPHRVPLAGRTEGVSARERDGARGPHG